MSTDNTRPKPTRPVLDAATEKHFRIECGDNSIADDGTQHRADSKTAIWESGRDLCYWAALTAIDDDYVFSWDHGQGHGRVRIPGFIMYDLPNFLTMLQVTCPGRLGMFEESRIYSDEPLVTLFPSSMRGRS